MVNSLRVLRMFMLAMKSMFNFYPEQIKLSTKSHCALSQYPPPPQLPVPSSARSLTLLVVMHQETILVLMLCVCAVCVYSFCVG